MAVEQELGSSVIANMVGVVGFEPTTSQFQTEPSTRLTLYSENTESITHREAVQLQFQFIS